MTKKIIDPKSKELKHECQIVKVKEMINFPGEDLCDHEYYFEIAVVISGTCGGAGMFEPKESNGEFPLIIIENDRQSTIIHEALHAVIDFFRTETEWSFNTIFDTDNLLLEESFCHYHNEFIKKINKAVKAIKEQNS